MLDDKFYLRFRVFVFRQDFLVLQLGIEKFIEVVGCIGIYNLDIFFKKYYR